MSIQLISNLHQETNQFPDSEKFGLTSQIRRSVETQLIVAKNLDYLKDDQYSEKQIHGLQKTLRS